jgi:type II secretory pathway component PulC
MHLPCALFVSTVFLSAAPLIGAEEKGEVPKPAGGLRAALKDLNADGADFWIYNDFDRAVAEAKRTGKPIFVTFRCVPCKACKGFDAEVASGSDTIAKLAADKFIALRQVEMKGVDLSQFQFDHDLNWAAMFVNADGVVYGRYGTQSIDGPDAYNSIASLEKAMQRVLKLHEQYPKNKAELEAKKGEPKPYKTALDLPALERKDKLAGPTAPNNCVHCHMIHDAEQEQARREGKLDVDYLYRYPLPDNIGVHIDRDDGRRIQKVTAESPAAAAGLKAGDEITHVNGQAIISIADIQWVLHNIPNKDATLKVAALREGKPVEANLALKTGWKKIDFLWRGSRWSLKPQPGFWAPDLTAKDIASLKLPEGTRGYKIQWINTGEAQGRKAKESGLKEGDVITAVDGKPVTLTPEKFHMQVRMTKKVGDTLTFTILRGGNEQRIEMPLVD